MKKSLPKDDTGRLGIDECRRLLRRPDMSDAEVAEFLKDLRAFLAQCLDNYFDDKAVHNEL